MKSRTRKLAIALAFSIGIGLMVTGMALAGRIAIDHFDEAPAGTTTSVLVASPVTPTLSGSFTATTSIGERDVIVHLTSMTGTLTSQSTTENGTPVRHYTEFIASPNASGTITYQWDGPDHSPTLSFGLGSLDLISGTNVALHVEVVQASHPVSMSIIAYTNATQYSSYVLSVPAIPPDSHVDFLPLFNNFTKVGGGANFADINALVVVVTSDYPGGSPGTTFQLDFLEASARRDYGDAPVSYEQNDPASHSADGGVRLGENIDTEPAGFIPVTTDATGDDITQSDDEDGVTPTGNWVTQGSILVDLEGVLEPAPRAACLSAWVDYPGSSPVFSPNEKVLDNYQLDASDIGQQTLITFTLATTNTIAGNVNGAFVRFRLRPEVLTFDGNCSNESSIGPTGYVEMGEVEDYLWTFGPTAVTVSSLQARSSSTIAVLVLVAAGLLAVGALGVFAFARRRRTDIHKS